MIEHLKVNVKPTVERYNSKIKKLCGPLLLAAKFLDPLNSLKMIENDTITYKFLQNNFGKLLSNVSFSKEFIYLQAFLRVSPVDEEEDVPTKETPKEKKERLFKTDPMRFWEQHSLAFPVLHKLATKILCIPASSAEVERSFSKHKTVATPKRGNLSTATLKRITFLQSNWNLFN